MTLKPTIVSPASIMARGSKGQAAKPQKMMVIDCKNETQWAAIHAVQVNGVVMRRRPIRAIESYLDKAEISPCEFNASQSQLRKKLETVLPLPGEEDEMRRKFLINDIAAMARVLVSQARSRDYRFCILPDMPTDFQSDPNSLKMILTYRGCKINFRQPKDKDVRSFEPYGVGLLRGKAYESPVEWYGDTTGDRKFYLSIEPAARGRAARR